MANASDEEQKLIRRLEAARERLVAATPSAGRGPLTPEQERELEEAKVAVAEATRALKGVINDMKANPGDSNA